MDQYFDRKKEGTRLGNFELDSFSPIGNKKWLENKTERNIKKFFNKLSTYQVVRSQLGEGLLNLLIR